MSMLQFNSPIVKELMNWKCGEMSPQVKIYSFLICLCYSKVLKIEKSILVILLLLKILLIIITKFK